MFVERKKIMKTTEERVLKVIAEQLGLEESSVTPEKALVADLGADSLDSIELVMALEDEFNLEIDDTTAEKVVTAQDAINLIKEMTKT